MQVVARVAAVLTAVIASSALDVASADRLMPADFAYLGAFRLPVGRERPKTFEYGGTAMTFRPDGDVGGGKDGFPGSLLVIGHPRLAYGELPDGSQIAEVSIPAPSRARPIGALPRARFVQRFHNIAKGRFKGLDEIPRIGLQFLQTKATGALIHIAWGQHFQPDPAVPSHAWIRSSLSRPDFHGEWFVATDNPYASNGYLFEIPKPWADKHVGSRLLATGRYRGGGWSGLGPSLYAYRPWRPNTGAAPPPGATLDTVKLL